MSLKGSGGKNSGDKNSGDKNSGGKGSGGKGSRLRWFALVSTAFSLFVCYGTLVLIALLGVFGMAVTFNERLWSGAIVIFAVLAVGGLGLGLVRHRKPWPVLLGGLGAVTIGYALYVHYDRWIEGTGFVLLGVAAIWDWRICHVPDTKDHSSQ